MLHAPQRGGAAGLVIRAWPRAWLPSSGRGFERLSVLRRRHRPAGLLGFIRAGQWLLRVVLVLLVVLVLMMEQ
jgi:hypothetical protein